MKSSHGGYAGRSLIDRIRAQMDKRRKVLEDIYIQYPEDSDVNILDSKEYLLNKGRWEGLAAALAILRSSSVAQEISESNQRIGVEE